MFKISSPVSSLIEISFAFNPFNPTEILAIEIFPFKFLSIKSEVNVGRDLIKNKMEIMNNPKIAKDTREIITFLFLKSKNKNNTIHSL